MAKSKIPNPLERRHLVERELPPAQALAIADAYLAENRATEAPAFLRPVASGDAFLLRAGARAMEAPPEREEWRRLAEAATAAGKERYADEARRQAERGEE